MPAVSKKQQRFFGAELARRREGKSPRAKGLSTREVREFASGPAKKTKKRS